MQRKMWIAMIAVLAVVLLGGLYYWQSWKSHTVKIGFNIALSGAQPKIGEATRHAAELLKKEVNSRGGLKVGERTYKLEFIYADNQSDPDQAVAAAVRLCVDENVLAIVGPQSSSRAIPAGEVCEIETTPMISPWSTNPKTTAFRSYVFRGCFLDPFQGPVAANFATQEFNAQKAAVLYDKESAYPKDLAKYFKDAFEKIHGAGSVVAFETFKTNDTDFSAQLNRIIQSNADVLFIPQYYNEVGLIVPQSHKLGWKKPIMGSDSWGSSELMKVCGDDCKGLYFTTHYAATGAKGETKGFIDRFVAAYGYVPDDVAALTWDSVNILLLALQSTKGLTSDLIHNRDEIKNQMAIIQDYEGITGKMSFTPEGDPIKCAVVVKINDAGEFEFYKSVCP